MNISTDRKNLFKYSINDYFNLEDKEEFVPYLWTSSYGLLRLLFLFRKNKIKKNEIEEYIKRVHYVLGRHSYTNEKLSDIIKYKLEWLKENETDILNVFGKEDPIIGSLRIGKYEQKNGEEPGIYLHYTTKWIYALSVASKMLDNEIYLFQACNILITMCEKNIFPGTDNKYPRKMKQELDKPEQVGEISHDPLDVFINILNLISVLYKNNRSSNDKLNKVRKIYIKLLVSALEKNISRIEEYNVNTNILNTNDILGIGFLLVSCYKIRIIINKLRSKMLDEVFKIFSYNKKKFSKLLNTLYKNLLEVSYNCLDTSFKFKENKINDDAYRYFGISIGLRAIKLLEQKFLNKTKDKKEIDFIKKILEYYDKRKVIHDNYNTISFCKGNWDEHKDINIVTFLYAKNPILN